MMTGIGTLSWSYCNCNLMKHVIYLLNLKFWEVLMRKYSFDVIPYFRKIFLCYVIRLWLQALSDPLKTKKEKIKRALFWFGCPTVESKKNGSWHDIKIHNHHHKGWLMVSKVMNSIKSILFESSSKKMGTKGLVKQAQSYQSMVKSMRKKKRIRSWTPTLFGQNKRNVAILRMIIQSSQY